MAKNTYELKAEKREVLGRKIKGLRKEGILPANIFGKDVKSLAVKVQEKEFDSVFKDAGETKIINLFVKGEKSPRSVLVSNLQLNPVGDQPLHVDFRQVDLKAKVTAEIPVELIGESLAVKEKLGILIQPLSEVEVEALPTDLPESFELDISSLQKVDDALTVADLKPAKEVGILTSKDEVLAKINALAEEEKEPVKEEPVEGEEVEGEEVEGEVGEKETESKEGEAKESEVEDGEEKKTEKEQKQPQEEK